MLRTYNYIVECVLVCVCVCIIFFFIFDTFYFFRIIKATQTDESMFNVKEKFRIINFIIMKIFFFSFLH